jgi:hypothetical protein
MNKNLDPGSGINIPDPQDLMSEFVDSKSILLLPFYVVK